MIAQEQSKEVALRLSHNVSRGVLSVGFCLCLALCLLPAASAAQQQSPHAKPFRYVHTFAEDPGLKIPSGFVPFRGAWKVQPYGHRVSQQHVLAQNSVSATRPLILMTQPMSRVDKMFVKVRLESGRDLWAGLVLCCTRDQPQAVLRINASQRELEFVRHDGTSERIVARHSVPVRPREWYQVALEADAPRTLTVTVNRRNAVQLQVPEGYSWRLGLETNTGTVAYFDDFGYEGVW